MARALTRRGHQVFWASLADLAWENSKHEASAVATQLIFPDENLEKLQAGTASEATPLSAFAAIHVRKDPPYDTEYIAMTWLLDSVKNRVRIYNEPAALRDFNEKTALFLFPDESRNGLISSNPKALLAFIKGPLAGNAILKPLTLFGGRGVMRIQLTGNAGAEAEALALLTRETADGKCFRIVQAFDESIYAGEVRAFAVGGEPMAWCLKKPAAQNFLANTAAGATLHPFTPSPALSARVQRVAQTLFARGVSFVGLDIIGDYVSEINLTSPRLLQAPGDTQDHYAAIATWLESDTARFHAKR